jgi:hypothetical protein
MNIVRIKSCPTVQSAAAANAHQSEFNFVEILARIRQLWPDDTKKDCDIANLLGVNTANISQWKSRGTVPFKELLLLGIKKGVDLSYLFTGVSAADAVQSRQSADPVATAINAVGLIRRGDGQLSKVLDTPNVLLSLHAIKIASDKAKVQLTDDNWLSALHYHADLLQQTGIDSSLAENLLISFCRAISR